MKRLLLILLPVVVGILVFEVQTGRIQRQFAIWLGSDPVIEAPDFVDLGEQEAGKIAIAPITIANRGSTELLVNEIRTNCACAGLERELDGKHYRIDSLRVQRNEQVQLRVRVSVRGEPGRKSVSRLLFSTNDPLKREAMIELVISNVKGGVTPVPTHVDCGRILLGTTECRFIRVYDRGTLVRRITKVECKDKERLTARLIPTESDPANFDQQSSCRLIGQIELIAHGRRPGQFQSQVLIYLNDALEPSNLVPVTGRVCELIEVAPSPVVLPRQSNLGLVYVTHCRCRSTEGKRLEVTVDRLPKGLSAVVSGVENDPTEREVRIEWIPDGDVESNEFQRKSVVLGAHVGEQRTTIEISVICQRSGGH
jgi:hypothetical protein